MDETKNRWFLDHILVVFIEKHVVFFWMITVAIVAVVVPTRFQWTVNSEYSWPSILQMTPIVWRLLCGWHASKTCRYHCRNQRLQWTRLHFIILYPFWSSKVEVQTSQMGGQMLLFDAKQRSACTMSRMWLDTLDSDNRIWFLGKVDIPYINGLRIDQIWCNSKTLTSAAQYVPANICWQPRVQSPAAAQRTWEANFQANGYKLAAPKAASHSMAWPHWRLNAGCCVVKGLKMSELFRFMSWLELFTSLS